MPDTIKNKFRENKIPLTNLRMEPETPTPSYVGCKKQKKKIRKRIVKLVSKDERRSFYNITCEGVWEEANYVEVNQTNQKLGGHYHKETRELFFIIDGVVNVEMVNVKTNEEKNFTVLGKDSFIIEPYWKHTLINKSPAKWVALLSMKFNPKEPDIHK